MMGPSEQPGAGRPGSGDSLRIDKWLWQARFCKSRAMASRLCGEGRIRASGVLVQKAHHTVRPGDVLTFPQGHRIRVVRILAIGTRRGPASEARLLYEDLAPEPVRATAEPDAGRRDPGTGRPTKLERRALDRLKRRE